MKHKMLNYVLGMIVFIFLICLVPNHGMKVYAASEIPIDYTPISTVEDLYKMNTNPHGKYMLTNDIDLSTVTEGNGWKPLKAFTGVLDGNGYRIKNLTIQGELSPDYYEYEYGQIEIGFFKYVRGTVKNIAFTDVKIDIVIEQRSSFGPNSHIGILCGTAGDGVANYPASIEQCYVTGNIKVKVDAFSWCYLGIGGLVGCLQNNGHIGNCYTNVRIHAVDAYTEVSDGSRHGNANFDVGGISSCNWYGDTMCQNCYARGIITAIADDAELCMIANEAYNVPSENCYYLSSSGGDEYATSLTENQMKIAKYYEGFDFENIWFLDVNSSYPYPQLQSCMHNRPKSIKIKSWPVKISYSAYESVDPTGATIAVRYEDGKTSNLPVTESMLSYDTSTIGKHLVTVSFGEGQDSFEISVLKKNSAIKGKNKYQKIVGDSFYLKTNITTDGTVTYQSSNKSIIKVNDYGKVTALRTGTAKVTIRVTEGDDYLAASKIITIAVKAPTLTVTSKYQKPPRKVFKLKAKKTGSGKISYKSKNRNIVTVSSTGMVKTKKKGKTVITVILKTKYFKTIRKNVAIIVK